MSGFDKNASKKLADQLNRHMAEKCHSTTIGEVEAAYQAYLDADLDYMVDCDEELHFICENAFRHYISVDDYHHYTRQWVDRTERNTLIAIALLKTL